MSTARAFGAWCQVVLLGLACCARDGDAEAKPKPVPPPTAKPPANPATSKPENPAMSSDALKWSLSVSPDKKKLLVDVSFHNTTGQKLYLAEKLVTSAGGNKLTRSDRLTVMNTDDPTVARFVLGVTSSDRPSTVLYEPTYEAVAPGATVKRHFELPLPLTSWHPVGGANPLSARTASARLIVQGFLGEPAKWTTLPSDDPQPIRVPELTQNREVFQAGPLPIPS
jgi:hypothetical protein